MLGFSARSWKRVFGEASWSFLCQLSVAVSGLVSLRIFTELAPREVFGEANLLLGLVGLFKMFFVTPINNAQLRYQPEYDLSGHGNWFAAAILRQSLKMVGVCAVVGLPAFVAWVHYTDSPYGYHLYAAMVAIVLLDCIESVRGTPISTRRNQRYIAWWHITKNWGFALFGSLALYLSATPFSFIAGQALGSLVSLIIFGWVFFPDSGPDRAMATPSDRAAARKRVFAYALPFPLLAVVGWVSSMGERYVMAGLLGAGDVALFVAAYSVASRPMTMAAGVLSMFARPILFEAEAQGRYEKAKRVLMIWAGGVVALGFAGVGILWVFGNFIASITLAKEYRDGAVLLFAWIGAAHAVQSLSQLLEQRLMSLGRTGRLLVPSAVTAVANVGFAYLWITQRGMVGVAEAKVLAFCCGFLALVAMLMATKRLAPEDTNRGRC